MRCQTSGSSTGVALPDRLRSHVACCHVVPAVHIEVSKHAPCSFLCISLRAGLIMEWRCCRCGSAVVGGYLIDWYGFRVTFLITATMQARACPQILFWLTVPYDFVHAGLADNSIPVMTLNDTDS